ncbi:MAG: hypothetical protein QF662_01825, partial [Phycisphaerae bacterium]|nr:hypothetical protein [Phycisphaerae bacterium]
MLVTDPAVKFVCEHLDTQRVLDLRQRVRDAMEVPPETWECPAAIDEKFMGEPIPLRKARAISLKLSQMPDDLWDGQLLAGSMTLESPRLHAERGFPTYLTDKELEEGKKRGLWTTCFGHIVPDYPTLLSKGLAGLRVEAEGQKANAETDEETVFLES